MATDPLDNELGALGLCADDEKSGVSMLREKRHGFLQDRTLLRDLLLLDGLGEFFAESHVGLWMCKSAVESAML